MTILQVKNLRKTFGSIVAVENISIEVEAGEVFTIIGPNGAGKTTTLEMIEGLQQPDQGEITVNGMSWKKDGEKIKQIIGVQPQSSALFDLLTQVFIQKIDRSKKLWN
jgi:ABC-2 type transport system ATP-binding protein